MITSDLWRAVETAAIALAGYRVPVDQDPRLRECNHGDLNGSPVAEVRVRQLAHATIPFPDGESYRDVVVRTASLLADLAASYSERARLLLIGHSANRHMQLASRRKRLWSTSSGCCVMRPTY